MRSHYFVLILPFLISACADRTSDYDASGSFEAIERIISAEATGKITELRIEEGQLLSPNDTIGRIDVTQLILQSEQVKASMAALDQKTNDAGPQVAILEAQLATQQDQTAAVAQQTAVLDKEITRFENLVAAKAAPQKQLDDLLGQRSVLTKQLEAARTQAQVIQTQIEAAKQNVRLQNRSILSEVAPTQKRLQLIENQIGDGTIVNQYPGTVLTQYAFDGEFTSVGKPLYKIADLSTIILRVYITGDQLAQVRLNDRVTVRTDDGQGGMQATEGVISWISSEAEFTPKTIQTKEERANLVYAVKVKVVNDGRFKIGMYGEIKFANHD